ncbi:hypothetical protein BDBG_04372 [Blastomyces gilchristii SLH14081]|uniref:Uncharacterized protein n=1 Tax=Blastomyces gilchristii (strain SLH14081) TaxID=559298 RepID=A0A179UMQ2_BLAGS|nr:uncharacterized protein BDBG_04372 [Blastomyces gilchristii SLH14081]OAT08417.1 hypothetical protein BDBG_04372 [Blastomyces gilchristii SLH14081]
MAVIEMFNSQQSTASLGKLVAHFYRCIATKLRQRRIDRLQWKARQKKKDRKKGSHSSQVRLLSTPRLPYLVCCNRRHPNHRKKELSCHSLENAPLYSRRTTWSVLVRTIMMATSCHERQAKTPCGASPSLVSLVCHGSGFHGLYMGLLPQGTLKAGGRWGDGPDGRPVGAFY